VGARAPLGDLTPAAAVAGADAGAVAPALGALEGIVGFHLARAAVVANRQFERHVGERFELTKTEFSLLMLLQANPGLSPKRLAAALAVVAPKLTLLLDRFDQRGLLHRERSASDGRSQHLRLTPRGEKLARDAAAAAAPMEREWHGRLTRGEHAMLIELLDKLAAA
jgi:DNA-binding MarR family transcriptional regulator